MNKGFDWVAFLFLVILSFTVWYFAYHIARWIALSF